MIRYGDNTLNWRENRFSLLLWGAANGICFFITWYVGWFIPSLYRYYLNVLILAVCYSGLQWLTLRRLIPNVRFWAVVTAFGSFVGFYLGNQADLKVTIPLATALAENFNSGSFWLWAFAKGIGFGLLGIILGLSISLPQGIILHRQVNWSVKWVVINPLILSAFLFVNIMSIYAYKVNVPRSLLDFSEQDSTIALLIASVISVVFGIAMALWLARLMRVRN